MEFKSLKNIESSFKQIRLFCIVFLCVCSAVTLLSVVQSYRFAEAQRQKIYVLDEGKSLMLALSQDLSQNRAAIESNLTRAMYLCDKSAYSYYQDLQEKGYYNRIVAGNINQRIEVDSVVCNFEHHPYDVVTYARQMIIRESNITERSLVSQSQLRNAVRSDNNPHGFIMERFEVVENKDIKTIAR